MRQQPLFSSSGDLGPQSVTRWQAALAAIGTSAMFFLLYGGAGWLTSERTDVGTWYYQWERHIPFVKEMIVPYMSIDLFFFAAPFFCRNRSELRLLVGRLLLVMVIAAACFVIYPLRLAVERPIADGALGSIYNWFTSIDQAYNLCPSMHIALRTVLAAHYGSRLRGIWNGLMHFWFFLIGCSTLLLYQHHVIDVVGGFVLAVLVMYAVDGAPWQLTYPSEWKMAGRYAAAAVGLLVPLGLDSRWGWLTIWPAVACLLVSAGYAWIGPDIYRRWDGRLSWPAKWVLGPVLAGQWLSWKFYAARSRRWDPVAEGVWIGRRLSEREARHLTDEGVVAVLDVCCEFDEPAAMRSLERLELPVLDLTAPTAEQLEQAVVFLEHRRQSLAPGQSIYVHCKAGYSRSAAIVAAWLLRTGRSESADEAFQVLRRARPGIVIRPEVRGCLTTAVSAKTITSESKSSCRPSTI